MASLPELTCSKCGETKTVDRFNKSSRTKTGYKHHCAECLQDYQRMYYRASKASDPEAHAELSRQRMLWKRHRITPEQYASMLEKQGGVCDVCKRPPSGKDKYLVVDHDHKCCPANRSCGKCVRGLLCGRCNMSIGLMQDDPETLEEAARYLRTASTRELT